MGAGCNWMCDGKHELCETCGQPLSCNQVGSHCGCVANLFARYTRAMVKRDIPLERIEANYAVAKKAFEKCEIGSQAFEEFVGLVELEELELKREGK